MHTALTTQIDRTARPGLLVRISIDLADVMTGPSRQQIAELKQHYVDPKYAVGRLAEGDPIATGVSGRRWDDLLESRMVDFGNLAHHPVS